jgi:hypothetical protein
MTPMNFSSLGFHDVPIPIINQSFFNGIDQPKVYQITAMQREHAMAINGNEFFHSISFDCIINGSIFC